MGLTGAARNGRWRILLVVALALASTMVIVACSGGKASNVNTPSPGDQPSPTAKPHAQPTIDGSTFNFPDRGYAVQIPVGWHANPNSLLAGPQTIDTFFSTDTVDGVQSNISVTCEDNATNVSTDDFVKARRATLTALGATNVQSDPAVTVSGITAQKTAYTLVRQTTTIAKIDVMFATPKCAWTLALASAPASAAQNSSLFDAFLQSFKLTSGSGA